ncbi:Uncharacterised protein [uncultured archaeon]|nr:Uncharacterised protein [uncultured archaeon]
MELKQNENRDLATTYFSFGDILAIGLMIASGLYFIITSALKIAELIFGSMNELDLSISIITVMLGYGFLFAAYRFIRRAAFLKAIADSIFVETLYDRLEPLLADIAETKAGYDILSERIDNLNYNVNDIRKSIEWGKTEQYRELVPAQFAKNIRNQFQYVMLTTITIAIYMFMFYNPNVLTPFIGPITYIIWWAVITSHHNLWEETKAWYWVAAVILVLPMTTIMFSALFSPDYMLLIMYLGLGSYILLFYIWCEVKTRGILPFGISERLKNIQAMIKKPEVREEKPHTAKIIKPSHIGTALLVLSVIVFSIALLGYLIENNVANLTWQMIGLDIKWEPVYSYASIMLGIVMLATGYYFLIKFRRQE